MSLAGGLYDENMMPKIFIACCASVIVGWSVRRFKRSSKAYKLGQSGMTIRFELSKYLQREGHPLSPRFSFDRNAINLGLALTYQAKGVHVAEFFRNVQKVHTLSKETRSETSRELTGRNRLVRICYLLGVKVYPIHHDVFARLKPLANHCFTFLSPASRRIVL